MDDQTFETVDRYALDPAEQVPCMRKASQRQRSQPCFLYLSWVTKTESMPAAAADAQWLFRRVSASSAAASQTIRRCTTSSARLMCTQRSRSPPRAASSFCR